MFDRTASTFVRLVVTHQLTDITLNKIFTQVQFTQLRTDLIQFKLIHELKSNVGDNEESFHELVLSQSLKELFIS